ncbi:hypothetical protein DXG01_016011 [Tephrocybe rancida]|nr:hypothetical protein DXG01_016011 [Tephrocybe rancida]
MSGETPSRPPKGSDAWLENGLTEDIWDTMEGCWKFDPSERLDVASILSWLDAVLSELPLQGVDPRKPQASLKDLDVILRRVSRGLGGRVLAKL